MILILLFALGLVFSFGIETSANHGSTGIAAEDVDPTDEAEVEDFLDHIIDYYDQVVAENKMDSDALTREVVIYGRALRQEGDYKNSENKMYSIGINERGFVTNHAEYPSRFGYELVSDAAGSAVGRTIQALIDGSGVGSTECSMYGNQGRYACATKVESTSGEVTVIAGLHHEENDPAFEEPDCSDFTLDTTAEAVSEDPSDANLVAYVKSIIEVAQEQMAEATGAQLIEQFGENPDLSALAGLIDPTSPNTIQFNRGVFARIYDKVACFGSSDLKSGNIYGFIMSANPQAATVLFNGNNFDLNGATLELVDDQLSGEQNIARLFSQTLGNPVKGANTYVNYHWDDPTDPDDDVPGFFETGKVPGTSCKRSYIEVANIGEKAIDKVAEIAGVSPSLVTGNFPPQLYIFGSGTYHEDDVCASGDDMTDDDMTDDDMMDDDTPASVSSDGGCAIAGTGNTSQGTLLNLLLTASVLFSAVFLRRRV